MSVVRSALAACLALAGCAPKTTPLALAPQAATTGIVSATLIPAGDTRMVTVRRRSDSPSATTAPNTQEILCSEPSPDWATAQARQLALSASGGVTGGANGSLAVNGSTTQTILAMAGRTAGVVALRDGLYAACQAYANGVIGKDGYALVLSQYGNLLVALAGGGAAGSGGSGGGSGGSGAATGAPAIAVAVSPGATPAAPTKPAADTTGNIPAASGNPIVAQMQQQQLQALLVACITDGDPTVIPASERNATLDKICPTLMRAVVDRVPALLTPAGVTDKPPASNAKPAAKPDASVVALQQRLRDAGENVAVDGILGDQTIKASLDYFAKQPRPAPAGADKPPAHG